jgi:hypothetical protein
VGQGRIPDEYHSNQRLSMRLSVLDGRGQETELLVEFALNREDKSVGTAGWKFLRAGDARVNWVKV